MGVLASSPSTGKSEVLATLKANGRSLIFGRLAERLNHEWALSDTLTNVKSDLAVVVDSLQDQADPYVDAFDDTGARLLVESTPPDDTLITLTNDGLAAARHPRARPTRAPY